MTEFDLPQLEVNISETIMNKQNNYYEQLHFKLVYNSVNPDTLFYSIAALYDLDVVSTAAFEYVDINFVLLNYFTELI